MITEQSPTMKDTGREISEPLGLKLDGIESSYRAASLGPLLYGLVRSHRPSLVVELGTFQGYSGMHLAAGLRDNDGSTSRIHLIDLWSEYPFRHCPLETTKENFARNNLLNLPNCDISFIESDALKSSEDYEDGSIDLLHIDVSNTGDKLRELLEQWDVKLSRTPNSLIVLEGGSAERDQVDWMLEHKMTAIEGFLASEWLNERYTHFCFQPFPSISILRHRDDSTS